MKQLNLSTSNLCRLRRWSLMLCLAVAGFFSLSAENQAHAAGCQQVGHIYGQGVDLHLEASLLGKWQYVGGSVYYLFHPVPTPCEGPGCRQVPVPGSEMSVVPSANDRTSSTANSIAAQFYVQPQLTIAWRIEDLFCTSPALSGMLRPPCCA